MTNFIVRRLLAMLVTLWVVFTVSFLLMRAVPGGPYSGDRNLPPEIEENVKHRYRLDLPLYEQYWIELKNVASGDLGMSVRLYDFNVNQIIAQGLPISASLGILAMAFALTLGISAGIVSAAYRGSFADLALMSVATVGIALPSFVVAGLAILLFVFVFPIFPAAGWGTFQQLVLPAVCLGALYAAEVARITRTSMLDVLSQDHIRTARAKGLGESAVLLRHALPGALLPVVSFLGPATAGILTGSVVIEKIFAIPGLGWHFVQAALTRDYTLTMGLVLLYTFLLFTLNFLVDLSYRILDPRVELS
jgi:oligopeptide transport system permease protein